MIINSQRTIYGLEYVTSKIAGDNHVARPNTTLNEKHGILPTAKAPAGTDLGIKYLAIGIGGNNPVAGINEYSYSQHGIRDAALFQQVPFVMRTAAQDLTATEQALYKHRVSRTVSGVQYFLYYLKVLQPMDISRETYIITPAAAGPSSLSVFTTDTPAHLNPVSRATNRVPTNDNGYISAMIKIKFSLTPAEMQDIQNAIDLLYGTGSNKILTEIGVCGGAEASPGGEAVEVQIHYHVGTGIDIPLIYNPTTGYSRAIEIGGSEPLYA